MWLHARPISIAPARLRGMTLIELVLVIALISLLMGMGLGMFASLRPGERAAVGVLQSTLRSASNAALHHAATASVHLEPGGSGLRAEVLRVVGTWHFEDPARVRGAFGLDGSLDEGGTIVDDGWQGRALSFAGEPARSRVAIAVQSDPAWNFERGFLVELALRRSVEGGAPIFAIAGTIALEVGTRGELVLAVLSQVVDAQGVSRAGEKIRLRTDGAVLGLERWHVVRAGYDLARLWLSVDGVEVAELRTEVLLWRVDGSLVLGGGDRPFAGAIDALSVRAVESDQPLTLPAEVRFAEDAPARIVFAPGGRLDPVLHPEPVKLELEYAEGRRRAVRVELHGTVQ